MKITSSRLREIIANAQAANISSERINELQKELKKLEEDEKNGTAHFPSSGEYFKREDDGAIYISCDAPLDEESIQRLSGLSKERKSLSIWQRCSNLLKRFLPRI
jgi:hypothetical protein